MSAGVLASVVARPPQADVGEGVPAAQGQEAVHILQGAREPEGDPDEVQGKQGKWCCVKFALGKGRGSKPRGGRSTVEILPKCVDDQDTVSHSLSDSSSTNGHC